MSIYTVVTVITDSVIATLAKNVLSTEQNWPELFGLLEQLVQHADPGYRGLCFSLLGQVIRRRAIICIDLCSARIIFSDSHVIHY